MEKITFLGDMKIIFGTVSKVFAADDVVREGTVSDMDFGDWLLQEGKIDQKTYEEKQQAAKQILNI